MAKCCQSEINSTAIAAKTYRRTAFVYAVFMRLPPMCCGVAFSLLELRAPVEAEPFPCD